MVAFAAAIEPDLTLVCGTQLPKPPECCVVAALGTLGGAGGERGNRRIFDNRDLPFRSQFCLPEHGILISRPEVAALTTFQLTTRGDQHALAFGAEHGEYYL